jgi:hypothetical protein
MAELVNSMTTINYKLVKTYLLIIRNSSISGFNMNPDMFSITSIQKDGELK